MANIKFSGLPVAGSITDADLLATSQGGVSKRTTQILNKNYANAGKAGGKTIVGGTAASENLILESTSHATKGEVQVPTGTSFRAESVIIDKIKEKTVGGGITFELDGVTGNFYDYTSTWFSMSGSGTLDDGTNFYVPYTSASNWYLGFGMGATHHIYMGTGVTDFDLTGDGQLQINKLQLTPAGQQIDEISIDGTMVGDSDTAVPTEKATKTYVDGHAGTNVPTHEILTISTPGQTAFTLTTAAIAPTVSQLVLNGQVRVYGGGNDFTVSGTSLTWNDPGGLTLETTDILQIWYYIA